MTALKYKYILFAFSGYSQGGGMNDLKLLFNTKNELLDVVISPDHDEYQLLRLEDAMISVFRRSKIKAETEWAEWRKQEANKFIDWINDIIIDER